MYAVYGRMAAVYGLNPYLAAPISISADALLGWASRTPEFATYGTPYGPAWTGLSAALAFISSQTAPLVQTLAYRCIGVAAHGANAYLIWRLAAQVDGRNTAALLYAWNPLALFESVAGGHNDGLMLSLVLAGLLLVFQGWRRGGASVVWAGALVKWVPGIVFVYVGCAQLKTIRTWRARAAWLSGVGALLVGVTLVFFGPWLDLQLLSAVRANAAAGGERYVNALLDLPTAWLVTHVIDRAGTNLPAAEASVRAFSFGAARLLLVLYVGWEALRLWRGASEPQQILEASARTLLVVLLVSATQVLAWYLTWPLALAAPLGLRSRVCQLTLAYPVLYLPIFYAIHEDMLPTPAIPPLLVSFALLPLVVVFLVSSARTASSWKHVTGGFAA
jgi:alpha-1,6-mannosyltransferase